MSKLINELSAAVTELVDNAPLDFMGTGTHASARAEEKEWAGHLHKVREAIGAVSHRIIKLEATLHAAACTFEQYEALHRAKGTPESAKKADVNRDLAAMIRGVLKE